MIALLPLLIGKSVTLAGAVMQTFGVLTFLTFDNLLPYRWHLILGGTALIAVSEAAIWFFYRQAERETGHSESASTADDGRK